jgi:hypothetical protein
MNMKKEHALGHYNSTCRRVMSPVTKGCTAFRVEIALVVVSCLSGFSESNANTKLLYNTTTQERDSELPLCLSSTHNKVWKCPSHRYSMAQKT